MRQAGGQRIVEAVPAVGDLADEAAGGTADAQRGDAIRMLPGVGGDLVDGDEQVERPLGRDPFRAEL